MFISHCPSHAQAWHRKGHLKDDPNWLPLGPPGREAADRPGVFRYQRGYMAYAGAGNNSRGTQLILAYQKNKYLGAYVRTYVANRVAMLAHMLNGCTAALPHCRRWQPMGDPLWPGCGRRVLHRHRQLLHQVWREGLPGQNYEPRQRVFEGEFPRAGLH